MEACTNVINFTEIEQGFAPAERHKFCKFPDFLAILGQKSPNMEYQREIWHYGWDLLSLRCAKFKITALNRCVYDRIKTAL